MNMAGRTFRNIILICGIKLGGTMGDKSQKRLEDLLNKEVNLFIHKQNINPTAEELHIITLAFHSGAIWGIGEMQMRFAQIADRWLE